MCFTICTFTEQNWCIKNQWSATVLKMAQAGKTTQSMKHALKFNRPLRYLKACNKVVKIAMYAM